MVHSLTRILWKFEKLIRRLYSTLKCTEVKKQNIYTDYFYTEDICIRKLRKYFYIFIFVIYVYRLENVFNNIQD